MGIPLYYEVIGIYCVGLRSSESDNTSVLLNYCLPSTQSNPAYDSRRCHVFQCDLTSDQLTDSIPPSSVTLVSLIFVLSSVSPDKMSFVLENVAQVGSNH